MRLLVVLGVFAIVAGCRHAPDTTTTRPVLRLAGTRFVESLAQEYARLLPAVTVKTLPLGSPVASVEAIQRGDADLGVVFADAAYAAYSNQSDDEAASAGNGGGGRSRLRAISTLHVAPLLLLVRADSNIHSVRDLRDHVVRLTAQTPEDPRFGGGWPVPPGLVPLTPGPPIRVTTISQLLLLSYGVNPADLRWRQVLGQAEALNALRDGTLDAMFMTVYDTQVVAGIPQGVRLIPFEGPSVDRLRSEYSFMRPITVPAGTYPEQTKALHTVGVDVLLICRSDLEEALVYELTRAHLLALPRVWTTVATQPPPDLERAAATPIPLHDGAARFYREWELFR
jgi:TRAP-type uncharacterized transport system substrate-binding protein